MKTSAKRIWIAVAIAAVIATGGVTILVASSFRGMRKVVPTIHASRGDLEIIVVTAGELRTPHSTTLVAPMVSGSLQLVSMLPTGSRVKKGDIVAEFDPSEQEYNLELNESQLKQAEQDIIKAKADAEVQSAIDQAAWIKARFDVRLAELEVQRNELLSEIDARKNNLALVEAKRKLAQLEQDIKSRAQSGLAGIKVLEAQLDAARVAMAAANTNIENMKLRSTINGIVSVKDNVDSTGGFYTSGIILPEYRAGDATFPGRPLAIVLDVDQMEVAGEIGEDDRSNVIPDQNVEIAVDAQPENTFHAKVKELAGMAARDRWTNTSSKKFEATFRLDGGIPNLKPGVSTQIYIHGNSLKNVVYLPAQCIFERDGKKIIYLKKGAGFEAIDAKVKYRTESRIVVDGITEASEVALVDPNAPVIPGKSSGNPAGMP